MLKNYAKKSEGENGDDRKRCLLLGSHTEKKRSSVVACIYLIFFGV